MDQLRWPFALGSVMAVVLVILVGVPFFLPLGGPPTLNPAELADAHGAFLRLDGETLYYTHQAGEGDAVILLHGFGGSTVTWQDTLPALAEAGYDAYAVDLAGFGLSAKGWKRDYGHAAQAARVIAFMDALHIDHAHVIGHSMGGNVAAHLALSYPDRVDRLVLAAGAVDTGQHAAHPDRLLPLLTGVLKASFARRWGQILLRRLIVPQFETLLFDAAHQDQRITPTLADGYRRALYTPGWDLGLMGIIRDQNQQRLPAPVSEIAASTLLLWGTEDTWVSPAVADTLARHLPNVQRVDVPDTGHLPMHEAPDIFNHAVLDFLEQAD